MSFHTPLLFIFVLPALWTSAEGRSAPVPCHFPQQEKKEKVAAPCKHYIVPPALCQRCRLRGIRLNGDFLDCTSIYRIDQSCQQGLAEYVKLNPCDTKRNEQLKNIRVPENRKALDFFLYAICEECCDCVPVGASPEEYLDRKAMGVDFLTVLNRGNCPGHAKFDICAVWPEVRDIVEPGEKPDLTRQRLCPMLNNWFRSYRASFSPLPLPKDWKKRNLGINKQITRFLRRLNHRARCRTKSVWQQCVELEKRQGQI